MAAYNKYITDPYVEIDVNGLKETIDDALYRLRYNDLPVITSGGGFGGSVLNSLTSWGASFGSAFIENDYYFFFLEQQSQLESNHKTLDEQLSLLNQDIEYKKSQISAVKKKVSIITGEPVTLDPYEQHAADEQAAKEEAVKKNNTTIGIIVLAIVVFIIYFLKKKKK